MLAKPIKFIFVFIIFLKFTNAAGVITFPSTTLLSQLERNGIINQKLLHRYPRQFDFTLSAEHDEKEDETEIALEAIANLWRSEDRKTQVDGSAKVIHQTNSLQAGNTRYSGQLHVHHDYKKK